MEKETMRKIDNLTEIRQRAKLTMVVSEEPDTETWINQAYAEQEIDTEISNLANRKANGNGRIPGEEYKATAQWATEPITGIMNQIKDGHTITEAGETEQ